MEDSRKYSVYPSDLDMLTSFKQFNEYIKDNNYQGGRRVNREDIFRLTVNPYRNLLADSFEEFIKLLGKYPYSIPLETHTFWEKKSKSSFANYVYVGKSQIEISVNSADLDIISAIHEKWKECFQASNPHQDKIERLSRYDLKKSVFLAHAFDDYGNLMASILSRFLKRLGFDVKEGAGYEAKDIPDKVTSKIKSQDIFICLVTRNTDWILSETAFAKGLNKYLILICQKDMSFKKGIIGSDYEHLLFTKDNIEKCFSDLVYALPI